MKASAFIVSLLLGSAIWLVIFGGFHRELVTLGPLGPWWLLIFVLVVLAFAWFPPTSAPIDRLLQRLSRPSSRTRVILAIVAALFTSLYLYLTDAAERRQFFSYIHDEFSYLIQAHQFARDRLWMPSHPIGWFFDSFQLFTNPLYASAYFPGTAITYLPGVWLHWQPFVTSLIVSGAVAGLLFWITTDLLDGVSGCLAVLLLLSDRLFRQLSIMTLSHMPLLLYGLLATFAWMRWRANRRTEWAIGIGFFLGLAAVTRPVDALCFAIPITIAVLIGCSRTKSVASVLGIGAGLMPFVVLQLLLNHGITGAWLHTPFAQYADREYPLTNYGFHPYDPLAKPESDLPQMQKLYDRYRPLIVQHRPVNVLSDLRRDRLRFIASQTSPAPFPMLVLLLPLSLLSFRQPNRSQVGSVSIVLAALPLFLVLYSPYFLFLPNYALATAPAVIIGILAGAKVLATAWPSNRRFATVGLTLFIAGTAIAALPNWWDQNPEDIFRADLLASINQQLALLPHKPAVVLFKFDPNRNVDEEPVYNADVAWPDDAEIIRAHDRGPKNREIFSYYAEHQPQRFFYQFDESNRTLRPLGSAAQLAVSP